MMGIFSAVLKKLLGSRYERILKHLAFLLLFYFAWVYSGITLPISYPVFLLMTMGLTFGVVLQLIRSDDMAEYLKGQFLLPFQHSAFNLAYCTAAAVYTLVTKTAIILALYMASCPWDPGQAAGLLLCFISACIAALCCAAYLQQKRKAAALLVPVVGILLYLDTANIAVQLLTAGIYTIVLLCILICTDSHSFYKTAASLKNRPNKSSVKGGLTILLYLFRYMRAHKNYLINTMMMWAFGCVFAVILGKTGYEGIMPLGLALLSLNTPVSILLSGDKSLYRKVNALPCQSRRFFIPYGVFIGLCNFTAYAVYLICWRLVNGTFSLAILWAAVLFALQSGILLVTMEYRFPIASWKAETDLWHHPRKYVVSLAMVLLAVLLSALSWMLYMLTALVAAQCIVIIRLSGQDKRLVKSV